MNKRRFRLIFNDRLRMLVAVAECSHSQRKGSGSTVSGTTDVAQVPQCWLAHWPQPRFLALALALVGVQCGTQATAQALPAGGQIVSGSARVQQTGSTLTIDQGSQNLGLNWQSFNIGKDQRVVFNQPSASSVALNRVVGNDRSQIYGNLTANGQVFLVNPNGILFAPGSQVDVGALVASTRDISDSDFAAGRMQFVNRAGAAGGDVINQGTLRTAEGGHIVLVGRQVANTGTGRISTPGGSTVLAAGERVELALDHGRLLSAAVDGATVDALVRNEGLIQAAGGQVLLTARGKDALLQQVVNNTGVIEARGVSMVNGVVVLDGGSSGIVAVGGTVDASGSGAGQKGGAITVLGQDVRVAEGARIAATGASGGGDIAIGGVWKQGGAWPVDLATAASSTSVGKDAVIDASATDAGNGGRIMVWGTDRASVDARLIARGGNLRGDGGKIETSTTGALRVGSHAHIDADAANGRAGDWLLDPADVTVVASGGDGTNTIDASTINGSAANVTVTGTNSVTVNSPIAMTTAAKTLTITGSGVGVTGGIFLNANVSTNNAQLTFNGITTLGANVSVGSGTSNVNFSSTIDADAVANNRTLSMTAGGSSSGVAGAIGSNQALSALTTTTGGTISFQNVTTSGNQSYSSSVKLNGTYATTANGANGTFTTGAASTVTLTGSTVVSTGSGNITIGNNLNADLASNTRNLTLNSSGLTAINGAIGQGAAITDLTTDAAGTTTVANLIATKGNQTYNDPLNITKSVAAGAIVFSTTALGAAPGGNFTVANSGTLTINNGTNSNLGINTGSGSVTFAGAIEGNTASSNALRIVTTGSSSFASTIGATKQLSNLVITGGTASLKNVTTSGVQTYGGNVILNGSYSTTNSALSVAGSTTLAGNTAISTGSGAVLFSGTVDADLAANLRTLTVNSSGLTSFSAAVGGTEYLSTLTTDAVRGGPVCLDRIC